MNNSSSIPVGYGSILKSYNQPKVINNFTNEHNLSFNTLKSPLQNLKTDTISFKGVAGNKKEN